MSSSSSSSPAVIEHEFLNSDSRQVFTVTFQGAKILTTLTNTTSYVDDWISRVRREYQPSNTRRRVVGLDVECRPNFVKGGHSPAATIQLCVGCSCLIFQLLHSNGVVPESLRDFLADPDYAFVGVGISGDSRKLREYDLVVGRGVELGPMAEDVLDYDGLRLAGLKTLTKVVLGYDVEKPKNITVSRWDLWVLTHKQIGYACVDSYLSYEIGRVLAEKGGLDPLLP